MADKENALGTKTIIAIVAVIVLLFIASISVGIFLADKGSSEAVDGNQIADVNQNTDANNTNTESPKNDDNNANNENKQNENIQAENNNQTGENNATPDNTTTEPNTGVQNNETTPNNNGTVANNNANNNGTTNNVTNNVTANNGNVNNNATNNAEITTGTDVNEVGETTVTRVEEEEKLVSKDFWDWWTPASVLASASSAVSDTIVPTTPDFTAEKVATTGVGENKLVYANKDITYTIKVTNNGEQELKNIEITDKIPEQTTFVSIDDAQNSGTTILENDVVIGLKWIVTVPAKESIEVKFTVKVNENATGTISNAAIVNGKESNEEKTSIINAKKSSKILERDNVEIKDGLEIAKLGDKIKYTITATNTGDTSGKTTIEDTVPVGTELIESSVTDDGKITTTTDNRKQISWNVELGANNTIERTFIVEVKDISGKIENVATVGGVPTNPDKKDTADIKVVKEVTDIKRDKESIGKDEKVQAGDAIEYKITVTNTGSVDLTNVVIEEKLEYVTIEALTINGELKTITKNNEGKLIIGDLKAGTDKREADKAEITVRYIVNYEQDIKGNVGKLIHNEAVATGETIPTEPDKTPENVTDKDEKDVPVDEVKALTINKTATKIKVKDSTEFVDAQNVKVRPGDIVEYTITITNTGNTTLENITVTDSLKVTVNDEEKDVDPSTGVSTIAVIPSLSAVSGENTTTIITYYTVTEEDVVDANPIKNVAKATVPDGPTEESEEEVPVNPDTSISVKKIWDDNNNQDGIRPDKITINLWADNKKIDSATISGTEYTFAKLPKYKADGSPILYTISEEKVDGYTLVSLENFAENGYVITNKHKVEKTKVAVIKKWEDSNNQDGIRPTSIIVKLMNGKEQIAERTISAEDNWTYTFENLDKKANGENISYTIEEVSVEGYTSVISGSIENGYRITNTHKVEKTSVKVSKVWDDATNQDGIRPKVINVILKANGEIVTGKKAKLNEDNHWSAEFTDLNKNKNGQEIQYTIEEVKVTGYTTQITGDAKNGYVITNTHIPEITSVKVQKVWEDGSNQDGIRPSSITVRLKANGTEVADKVLTLNDTNQWSGTFEELPKKAKGQKINYTVVEDDVEGYKTNIVGNAKQEYIIVNTHEVDKTSIEVTKVWDDNEDQDGVRPESVVINLVANNVVLEKQSVTLNEENNWSAKFDGLDKKANGTDIKYSVVESKVPNDYEANISVDTNNPNKFIVTNKHTTDETSITIRKSWDDANNQDGIRPTSIHAKLIADGTVKETVELNEANQWQHQFTNLPVNKDGKRITYTVDEAENITGYIKNVEGYTIQNKHIPEEVNIPVSKEWVDNNDQDGLRPSEVEVVLKANGDIVDGLKLNSDNDWNGTFANKPKKANGKDIIYTVEEINVKGYTSVVSGDAAQGYKITNTHEVEKTSVRVSKDWNDGYNQDGIRPSSITVRLKANGTEVASKTLDASNQWAGVFEDLYKKANGENITYTVAEDTVNGYTTKITGNATKGYLITNTHKPEETTVKVNKVWDDSNNQDGKRPTEVTVTLKENGEFKQTIELNNQNNWTHTFNKLPKKIGGKDINYTIEEVNIEKGYTAKITKVEEVTNGYEYNITNSYTPEEVSIDVTKKWDDANNQDGIRPESVVVDLYIGNEVVEGKTITLSDALSDANKWKATISGLPKYQNGKEIQYSLKEREVKGYKYSITGSIEQGVVITNIHTPETVDIPVSKKWENIDNDAARNEYLISSIILQVKNGTQVVEEKKVAENADASKDIAGNWRWIFKGLPKYEAGKLINYTVAEKAVNEEEQAKLDNYYKADERNGEITNTFDPSNLPDTKPIVLTKIWDDSSNKYKTRPSSVEFTVDGNDYILTAENVQENSKDIWTRTVNLPKYDTNGNEISYNATEKTVPDGYTKISEAGTTIINRANEIVEKKAYKADDNGNIGNNEVTSTDKFKANEIVYYKLIIKNPGNVTVTTKTLTDTLPLRLRLLSVAGTDISGYPQNGTDSNKDSWSVSKETDSRVKLDWTVSNLTAGETRELVIKAQVIPESEYKDICKETGNESTDLKSINNEVFMDNEKKDEVSIDLEEIKITGNITIKGVTSSTEKVNTPMDVVFVLDTSGSMTYGLNNKNTSEDSRAKAMVNAVNSSIKTIMSKNADSRIGVIGFSDASSTIIPLGKYDQNTDYLKYSAEIKGRPGWPGGQQEITQKIISNVGNTSERTVTGGTNTQSGIKAGAEMLMDAQNKQYEITEKLKVTRTPVLILVTDGEPTYYYANETATETRIGDGGATIASDEDYYYWTIRTAKYYKDQITKKYYPKEEDTSKVFTIGIGMSGYEATVLLDPNETNVKACDTNGYNYWGNRNQAGKLYDLLNKYGTPYAYDYADGTKSGSLNEKDIEEFLIKSIEQSSENIIEERSVTLEESTSRIIRLKNLDDTKKFVLTIGEVTYNSIDSAKNAGYLKGDSTNGYYLDFTRVDVSSNISLTYFQKK